MHLALVAFVSLVVGLLWSRRFLGADVDAVGAADPTFVRPPAKLIPLGLLAFACLLIEGASGDWSGVYLRDELGTSAGVAALGFTAFNLTMTAGRIVGDRLVSRSGRSPWSARAARSPPAGSRSRSPRRRPRRDRRVRVPRRRHVGRGPDLFRSAGHVGGMAPQLGLAAVSSTGYLGFMVGPPVIGGIAESWGSRAP